MAYTLRELHDLSDDELVELHDRKAEYVVTSLNYFLDEIRRREVARAMESSRHLAIAATLLSAVATVAAVIALFVR